MTDYATFQTANAVFPLTNTSGNTLLQDADPALYHALAFWSAMIQQHVGTRLVAAMTAAGVSTAGGSITSAVMAQYPYDVTDYMVESQVVFPCLAAFRRSTSTRKLAADYEDDTTKLSLMYVLPPLTAAQAEQVFPILGAVYKVLRNRTTAGWDPSYTPPGGASVTPGPWSAAYANIEEIGITSAEFGKLPGEGNLIFPTLLCDAYVIERDNYVADATSGNVKYAGGDIAVSLVNPADGTSIANVVQTSTQLAPTLTSLSVTTGTIQGGTAVTITGTLFNPAWTRPHSVYFGGVQATSVVVVNATTITCVTPAVAGPGVVAVTFTNGDGQSASLGAAYTYTSP